MNLHRLENENEEQFLWRLGNAKDNGLIDLDWPEIADIMNKEFRSDESDYRAESAYRKPYQQAKRFFSANVFKTNSDDYIEEIQSATQDLKKERQKISDERAAMNKKIRESARAEADMAMLETLIRENGRTTLPRVKCGYETSGNDLFVSLSDFHLGLTVNNAFGQYDSDIAAYRLHKYAEEIIRIRDITSAENCYVGILGDVVSGEIHLTTQLENRENLTQQIQKSAELLSAFVYELSKHFRNVYVNSVSGNHSRTTLKDNCKRDNRLDDIIPWYIEAKLSHIDNVKFLCDQNYDSTIGRVEIRGNEYIMVHGDYDSFDQHGLSKIMLMIGHKPTGIFYGHMHHCSYDSISDVALVRSGCFSGAIDDYVISKRISGRPQQMVCVVDSNGINSYYPVDLT